MANQIINVVVNSKGAVTVRKELSAIGDSAKSTATYLNGLRGVLAAALTFSGAGQITETIDNFVSLQNRLRQVASETDNVSQSWSKLLQIANSSYSTIDNTVNLYFRVAQAYKAWGESAEGAYKFTELFQKAAVLSGSTMQTTSQAVYQFSQALNKGKLDGDEFRSVLEGLPYVANLIQKSLGVTRAELYEMSKQGKISVDRIKEAFESAADSIQSDWKNITPTIGMALVVLNNNWTDFLGSIQTSTGVFSGIASLILLVANNFGLLAVALSPVVVSLGFLAGRLGLGLVVTGFRDLFAALKFVVPMIYAFNAAMMTNPLVLVATLIAAVVVAVIYFRNELGLTNEVLISVWTSATTLFSAILSPVTMLISGITSLVASFVNWDKVFSALSSTASTFKQVAVSAFQAVVSAVSSAAAFMKKTWGPVFQALGELVQSFVDLVMQLSLLFTEMLTPAIMAVLPVFKALWAVVQPALEFFVLYLTKILEGWTFLLGYLQTVFAPGIKAVFEGWAHIIETVVGWIKNLISLLKTALALMSRVGGGGGGGTSPGAHNGAQFYAGEFANGGGFKVPGTGAGRDTTPVAFRAERGERVTVETKRQQRDNDNSQQASVNVPVNITNVFDPSTIPAAMESSEGRKSIVNVIKAGREEFRAILGVY